MLDRLLLTSSKSSGVITFGGGSGGAGTVVDGPAVGGLAVVGTLARDGLARSRAASTKHIRLGFSSIFWINSSISSHNIEIIRLGRRKEEQGDTHLATSSVSNPLKSLISGNRSIL